MPRARRPARQRPATSLHLPVHRPRFRVLQIGALHGDESTRAAGMLPEIFATRRGMIDHHTDSGHGTTACRRITPQLTRRVKAAKINGRPAFETTGPGRSPVATAATTLAYGARRPRGCDAAVGDTPSAPEQPPRADRLPRRLRHPAARSCSLMTRRGYRGCFAADDAVARKLLASSTAGARRRSLAGPEQRRRQRIRPPPPCSCRRRARRERVVPGCPRSPRSRRTWASTLERGLASARPRPGLAVRGVPPPPHRDAQILQAPTASATQGVALI